MNPNTENGFIMTENKVHPSSRSRSPSSYSSSSSRHSTTMSANSHQVVQVEEMSLQEDQHTINLKTWKRARNAFNSGKTLSYPFRLDQLQKCKHMLEDNAESMIKALYDDLRKPRFEAVLAEIEHCRKDLIYHLGHLKSNMKAHGTPYNFALGPLDEAYVKYDPYGVVLVIGVWNYPIGLSLGPLFGAIAAGNCVVLKPSEIATSTSTLLAQLIPKYLDEDCFHVIEAELDGTLDLLKLKFDYILAVGSTAVGKSIMKAAAEHLTPVTLELGGKSPVYIDESTNIEYAIKRTLWGKGLNLGQSCIAPDYILCCKVVQDKIIELVPGILREWYGEIPQGSPDLARIVNERHFGRLKKILDETKGKVICGGDCDIKDLWISPAVLVDVKEDDIAMQDEIFGPILPILRVESPDEAIEFINARPKPLALYLFSRSRNVIKRFKNCTSSGQLSINDVMVQSGWKNLPFGGVGDSGMGRYHDVYSFTTFSHTKAILHRTLTPLNELAEKRRYPPHADKNIKKFVWFLRSVDSCILEMNAFRGFIIGVAIGIILKFLFSALFPCIF